MVRNRNIAFVLVAPSRGNRFGDVKAAARPADNDRYLLARTDGICIDRCPEQIAVALVRGTAEKRPCAIVQQAVASDLFLHLGHHSGIGALRVDLKILIIVQFRQNAGPIEYAVQILVPVDRAARCALAFPVKHDHSLCAVIVHFAFSARGRDSFPVRGIAFILIMGNACNCNGISRLPVILLLLQLDRLAHVVSVLLRNRSQHINIRRPHLDKVGCLQTSLDILYQRRYHKCRKDRQNDQHNDQFHQRKSLAGIFLFLLHFISTFY